MKEMFGNLQLDDFSAPNHFFEPSSGVFIYDCVSILKQGHRIGELGLITQNPRAATIVAREDCDLAVLNGSDFKRILHAAEEKKIQKKKNFYANTLFRDFNRSLVFKLSYLFEKRKFFKNQVIFHQNEPANGLYLIKKGEIEV